MGELIRINKYIADSGICSRREADRMIEGGLVFVNGKQAESGMRVSESDEVVVDGKPVRISGDKVYLLFNKPAGIVCTADKREKNNIINYINYKSRIMYAGRLDKDSEGLMLMTNDGDLINALMRAKNKHEKEYIVTVDKDIDKEFIRAIRNGVYLEELGVTTRKCKASIIDSRTFSIVLTEGYNRQIRRMCEALFTNVISLIRIRIANLTLDDIEVGKYRDVTNEELEQLFSCIKSEKGINNE